MKYPRISDGSYLCQPCVGKTAVLCKLAVEMIGIENNVRNHRKQLGAEHSFGCDLTSYLGQHVSANGSL